MGWFKRLTGIDSHINLTKPIAKMTPFFPPLAIFAPSKEALTGAKKGLGATAHFLQTGQLNVKSYFTDQEKAGRMPPRSPAPAQGGWNWPLIGGVVLVAGIGIYALRKR